MSVTFGGGFEIIAIMRLNGAPGYGYPKSASSISDRPYAHTSDVTSYGERDVVGSSRSGGKYLFVFVLLLLWIKRSSKQYDGDGEQSVRNSSTGSFSSSVYTVVLTVLTVLTTPYVSPSRAPPPSTSFPHCCLSSSEVESGGFSRRQAGTLTSHTRRLCSSSFAPLSLKLRSHTL